MTRIQSRPAPAARPVPDASPGANGPSAAKTNANGVAAPHSADSVDVGGRSSAASPREVMTRFYDAFTHGRLEEVEALYAPDVRFKDEIFSYDNRDGTMNMWRKLIGGGGAKIRFEFDRAEGDVAYGRWVADYKVLGRPVRNEIQARMVVRDGRIVEHQDSFSWSKWVRQALPLGALGATKPGKAVVTHLLRAFIDR